MFYQLQRLFPKRMQSVSGSQPVEPDLPSNKKIQILHVEEEWNCAGVLRRFAQGLLTRGTLGGDALPARASVQILRHRWSRVMNCHVAMRIHDCHSL